MVLVAQEDDRIAALKGVRLQLAVRLERVELAALELARVRQHEIYRDERAVVKMLCDEGYNSTGEQLRRGAQVMPATRWCDEIEL